jgi:hypothetical protein
MKKQYNREEVIKLIQENTHWLRPPEWLITETLTAINRPEPKKIPLWKGRPGVPVGGIPEGWIG